MLRRRLNWITEGVEVIPSKSSVNADRMIADHFQEVDALWNNEDCSTLTESSNELDQQADGPLENEEKKASEDRPDLDSNNEDVEEEALGNACNKSNQGDACHQQ